MSNKLLIDREAFAEGYASAMSKQAFLGNMLGSMNGALSGLAGLKNMAGKHLGAGGGGLRDNLWNSATDTTGKFMAESANKAMDNGMDKTLNQAGQTLGSGAVSGGVNEAGNQINKGMDWLGSKTKDLMGQAKDFGTNLLNDPGKTIQENPWTSAGIGAAAVGAGYFGGKALGLWGGDNKQNGMSSNGQGPSSNNMSSNGQSPPPMMQSAYTQGYTPMALSKASMELPLPPMVMSRLNPALDLGSSIYNAVNSNTVEEPQQKEVIITPETDKVNKLMQNPKMRAYITSLVRDTNPQM